MPAGVALSRSRLDAALVEAATDAGARFLDEDAGHCRRTQRRERDGCGSSIKGGRSTCAARVVMVASGLGSKRPRQRFGGKNAGPGAARESARAAWSPNAPGFYDERTIFMAVGREGYVGAVRVEDGALNVAAAFEPALVRRWGTPALAAVAILAEAGFPPIAGLENAPLAGDRRPDAANLAAGRGTVVSAR